MSNIEKSAATTDPDRIDPRSSASIDEWARKLNVTQAQLQEAVASVGDCAADVEMHLKGSRSTSNVERMDQAPEPPG